jgi:hypothetical protein
MKQLFTFFFLVIMTLNVTLPLVEQLQGKSAIEYAESDADDSEKESKKEKEKESVSCHFMADTRFAPLQLGLLRKSIFAKDELPDSELHASLPERPPKV